MTKNQQKRQELGSHELKIIRMNNRRARLALLAILIGISSFIHWYPGELWQSLLIITTALLIITGILMIKFYIRLLRRVDEINRRI